MSLLLQVTLTVDGLYTERWMTSGSFSVLASSTVFLGGSEATFSLPGTKTNNNLVGCLKKVGDFKSFDDPRSKIFNENYA